MTAPLTAVIERVLAEHRLTYWSVYHRKDGGQEAAPRCTCGVLWSAGDRDAPLTQIARHEAHVAAEITRAVAEDEGLRVVIEPEIERFVSGIRVPERVRMASRDILAALTTDREGTDS